jgi:hypothetical protein
VHPEGPGTGKIDFRVTSFGLCVVVISFFLHNAIAIVLLA